MRISIIDLGSNSVRFEIFQIYKKLSYEKIYGERLMIKLGEDVFSKKKFSSLTIKNTCDVFKRFAELNDYYLSLIHISEPTRPY